MNTKGKWYVYVVYRQHDEQTQTEVRRYGFDAFADAVLPFTREELRQKREARAFWKKKSERQKAASKLTIQSLHKARAADLIKLAGLRGGIKEGHREVFLFDLMCSLCLSGECTDTNFFAIAKAMAAQCCPDFSFNDSRPHDAFQAHTSAPERRTCRLPKPVRIARIHVQNANAHQAPRHYG